MAKLLKYIIHLLIICSVSIFTSCEEVVEVDLNTAPPRLVVDASINWVKGTDGSQQTIKLTTTTGYYNPNIPVVSGATVFVTNSAGTIFDFVETPGTGEYVCSNFVPVIGENYTLTVISGGQTYTATETLYAVPDILYTTQDNEGGFFNEDVEVRFFFQDEQNTENFYMCRFDAPVMPYPDYDVFDDRFNENNEMFGNFSHEDLTAGQVINFKLFGVSERYYNYMAILINLAEGGSGGGPFQTPPSTVRGNIINQTNEGNYALGYFRLSEVDTLDYTVE
jgi:hypothetical protein